MSQDLDEVLEVESEDKSTESTTSETSASDPSAQTSGSGAQSESVGSAAIGFAVLFYSAAAIFVVVGFVVAYQDSSYDNSIVEGDAYNYIIFAGRGIAWMTAAVVSSVVGLACQLGDSVARLRKAISRPRP